MNLYKASSQWASRPDDQRFESLGQLQEAVSKRRAISSTRVVKASELKIYNPHDEDNVVKVSDGKSVMRTTHWSFGQLCSRAGAPAGYLRKLPAHLARPALAHGLKQLGDEDLRVLSLGEDEEDILQATTSPNYGRIWDCEVVDCVSKIVKYSDGKFFNPKEHGGKPSGLYASDHDVFMFMIDGGSRIDGGGERDQLHRGFFVWNSEVGSATMGISMFLFREVCGNHIVWGAQDIKELRIRHDSRGPNKFAENVTPTLLEYVNSSAKKTEESIRKAKQVMLPIEHSEIVEFGMTHGLTKAEVRRAIDFAKAEEGDCSNIWELVQGLTASARAIEWIDARLDLEKRAGALLTKFAN